MSKTEKFLPTNLVIFGITGDLATKKILPALFSLHKKEILPKLLNVVGFSRREFNNDGLQDFVFEALLKTHSDLDFNSEEVQSFLKHFFYQQGDFTDISGYDLLSTKLGRVDDEWNVCSNKLFYLSVPPKFYGQIFDYLADSGLTKPCSDKEGWTRVIVEKPFGKNLDSAKKLDEKLSHLFKEEQIYRIDHYLGKEMMQNILLFRFANNLLERNWDKDMVEKIEIAVFEDFGVENRINFYDGVGALRDVGQNHLLQMLAYTTMDAPTKLDAEHIRKERERVLDDIKIMKSDEIVAEHTYRAQYEGYLDIEGVEPNSTTETYFKLRVKIDNDKWDDVPITIESGKKMHTTDKKIKVYFKPTSDYQNVLTLDLDGDDAGIYIDFWAKKPGFDPVLEKRTLSFSLCEDNESCDVATEYEQLILDCIRGDQTLFVSTKEIEHMWEFVDPILKSWADNEVPLEVYKSGYSGYDF